MTRPPTALTHARKGGYLGRAILAATLDVSPDKEDDFNAWYSHEHLHERIEMPGFNRGTRWLRSSGDATLPGKYLTIYEGDDVSVFRSPAYLKSLDSPTPWTQEMGPSLSGIKRTVSRVLGSAGPALGRTVSVLEFTADDDEELIAWFWNVLVPQSLDRPELCGVHLCAPDAEATREKEATAEARASSEPDLLSGYTLIAYGLDDSDNTLPSVLGSCAEVPFDLDFSPHRLASYSFITALLSQDLAPQAQGSALHREKTLQR